MSSIHAEIRRYLKPRPATAHKGQFGRLFIVAGARGLSGAAYLAGMGALRSGAGLVTLGIPASLHNILARRLTEVMTHPLSETKAGALSGKAFGEIRAFLATQDVLAIGPGLTRGEETVQLLQRVIPTVTVPMVIDADGLNAFEGKARLLAHLKAPAILTPHPGEFRRLFQVEVGSADTERKRITQQFAKRYHVVVVLKGHHTVVAAPTGELFVNPTGNPGLAKGGSGDVLCGMAAGLLAQQLSPFQAAKIAVYLHGLAADLAVKQFGEVALTATDVLAYLPRAFKRVLHK